MGEKSVRLNEQFSETLTSGNSTQGRKSWPGRKKTGTASFKAGYMLNVSFRIVAGVILLFCQPMDNKDKYLGQVFNSRSRVVRALHLHGFETKTA